MELGSADRTKRHRERTTDCLSRHKTTIYPKENSAKIFFFFGAVDFFFCCCCGVPSFPHSAASPTIHVHSLLAPPPTGGGGGPLLELVLRQSFWACQNSTLKFLLTRDALAPTKGPTQSASSQSTARTPTHVNTTLPGAHRTPGPVEPRRGRVYFCRHREEQTELFPKTSTRAIRVTTETTVSPAP